MKNIFTIPPNVSFAEALAWQLWQESKGEPFKLTDKLILLPTRRSCRHLREAFLRVIDGKAALLPRIQPLGDIDETGLYFAQDFALPLAIAPLRRQMLLTRLIRQKDKTLPIGQAARLAEALAKLLDQVQTERANFANLSNLVPENLAKHWQETLKFLDIVTSIWPKILEEEGCLDPAERQNLILKAQAENWKKSPPPHPIIAAGSTASIPAVADLMAVIAGLPEGRIILPGLDQELDEEAWQAIDESHPQYGMKKWLEQTNTPRPAVKPWPQSEQTHSFRPRLLQEAMRPAETTQNWSALAPLSKTALKGFERLELEHQQEEADVIALRLRAALEEKNKTAALVTPDRPLAERVSAALRRWGIEANDSAGAPLTSLPAGSFLQDVLAAASPEASAIDYLSLLKHPLAAGGIDPARCRHNARKIEIAVWRGVSLTTGLQGALHALKEIPSPSRGLSRRSCEAAKTEGSGSGESDWAPWLEHLTNLFTPITLSWPMPLPLSERITQHLTLAESMASTPDTPGPLRLWRGEAGDAAAEFFADWKQAAQDLPPITGDDYADLLTTLMRGVIVRPAYGLHPRISILGPLEARLHHADLMILGGMNEGVWPPDAAVDPWLSRPMKRDFGLPLPERRIGLSAHDFVQLASAPEVLLTRARRVEGAPAVPSRFLLQTEAVLKAHGFEGDPLAPEKPWRAWAKLLDTPGAIKPCDPPEPCPPVNARPTKLSVTEIGTWHRNPYAIYARRILNLNRLEDIDADPAAAERGTIIHEALEKFLDLHKTTWPPNPLADLLAIGREVFAPYHDRPQVAAFWWPRFERIANRFIAREIDRRKAGIRPLAVEGEGKIAMAKGAFTLKGRADRIDRLSDGTIEIIDYKTGTLPTDKDIDLGYEPQLPLLALIAEEGGFKGLGPLKTGALTYWQLKGANADEETRNVKGDLATQIRNAREKLEQLLAEFAKPETPYRAEPRARFAPRYDDYAHLARLPEWARPGGDT